ncbi:MAG: response regulator transcription factor [Chitinophagaceae bacterium]|nr:MAG: response regulator transcription factor [Chitinophagaceae bacterium]
MTEANKIHCMIVDDEPPAVETLRTYVESVSSLKLQAVCYNAIEASNVLRTAQVDLLFLDIQMPHLLGTDLVRTLKSPPAIIFTTAYRKFAVDGFELDAVDYLLKPISFERFLKSVNKVIHHRATAVTEKPVFARNEPSLQLPSYVNLRVDRKNLKVNLDEILFIESLKDYVKVVTTTKVIITKQSISFLEETLQYQQFLRIHRSYLISVDKVESFTNNSVGIGKHELPISRMYRLEVEKQLGR